MGWNYLIKVSPTPKASTFTAKISNVWMTFDIVNNEIFLHGTKHKRSLTSCQQRVASGPNSQIRFMDNDNTYWMATWIPSTLDNELGFTWTGGGSCLCLTMHG